MDSRVSHILGPHFRNTLEVFQYYGFISTPYLDAISPVFHLKRPEAPNSATIFLYYSFVSGLVLYSTNWYDYNVENNEKLLNETILTLRLKILQDCLYPCQFAWPQVTQKLR
jgi:hypothetical protein